MRSRLRYAGAAAGAALLFGVWWLWEPHAGFGSEYPKEAELLRVELEGEAGEAAIARAYEHAREVRAGRSGVEGPIAGPSTVYVCALSRAARPACRSAAADSLADAVAGAARQLPPGPYGQTLTLDVEIAREMRSGGALGDRKRDPGLWGYRVGDAFLVPWEVLGYGVFGGKEEEEEYRPEVVWAELRLRFPDVAAPGKSDSVIRFRTMSWVQEEGQPARRLYRLHAKDPHPVDADALRLRAAWAADHLADTITTDGRIRYTYNTVEAREERGYNLLRHGGSTYALLQAYQRFGNPSWRLAAEAAIRHLLSKSRRDVRNGPFGGGETLWVDESSHIKLGGAGLALVMLTQHIQATGDPGHLADARAYARFLVSQQQQTGEFVYFAPKVPGDPPKDQDSAYYPGEAILGLMQLYAIDPDPLWLDTAKRGADWLIDTRDAGLGPSKLSNDHWLMIALSHLVKHTGDPRYVAHSKKLAAAVRYQAEKNASKVATHADYLGGYYDPPRSTPAATRGEGLVAVLDTCALVDDPCEEVRALLLSTIQHQLWSQYGPDDVWWMQRPGDVVGGFAGGVMDPDLRNDFTQHNLSALLGAERHLRAPGERLPGGPTWTSELQAAFVPPVAEDRLRWLRPLVDVRGRTRGDAAVVVAEPPAPTP